MEFEVDVIVGREVQVVLVSFFMYVFHVCFVIVKLYTYRLSWFNWWVSFAPEFQCCYFCESSCLFCLSFNFDFYVS